VTALPYPPLELLAKVRSYPAGRHLSSLCLTLSQYWTVDRWHNRWRSGPRRLCHTYCSSAQREKATASRRCRRRHCSSSSEIFSKYDALGNKIHNPFCRASARQPRIHRHNRICCSTRLPTSSSCFKRFSICRLDQAQYQAGGLVCAWSRLTGRRLPYLSNHTQRPAYREQDDESGSEQKGFRHEGSQFRLLSSASQRAGYA
jgi:hypothetical protein